MSDSLRMPAEWEHHEAMWLAWPHDRDEWGDDFEPARVVVAELVRQLRDSRETVELLVPGVEQAPGDDEHAVPYGDIWLRDTGPLFVESGDSQIAVGFQFNGWGGKYDFPGDKQVAEQIAALAGAPFVRHSLVAEGGALEVDGQGTVITTRQCLLNRNRNPHLSQEQVEQALTVAIGAKQVIWLERGLAGDHTDGHVDNLARFVAHARVLCAAPERGSPNHDVCNEVRTALAGARDAHGSVLEVVTIPSPEPMLDPEGRPMPASYCNFLIANECVIVPVFEVSTDNEALEIFADLFPSRRIVALNARALLSGGGTVHCISQQQPTPPRTT